MCSFLCNIFHSTECDKYVKIEVKIVGNSTEELKQRNVLIL